MIIPADIDPTGQVDVSAALHGFLTTVPDGGYVVFPPGARYLVNGAPAGTPGAASHVGIRLFQRRGIRMYGNGAEMFATQDGPAYPGARRMILLEETDDCELSGLVLRGSATTATYEHEHEFDHALAIRGGSRNTFRDMQLLNFKGDWLAISPKPGVGHAAVDNAIYGSSCDIAGRQGIAVGTSEGTTIEGNRLGSVGRSLIDLEPDSANPVTNVAIRGNRFEGTHKNYTLAAANHIPKEGVLFEDNVATTAAMTLAIGTGSDWTVRGNVAAGINPNPPIRLWGAVAEGGTFAGALIEGNEIPVKVGASGPTKEAISLKVPGADCVCKITDIVARDNAFPGAARLFTPTTCGCGYVDGGGNVY